MVNKRSVVINSANRLTGNSNNFSYKINDFPITKYNYCTVLAAYLPKSWYMVKVGDYFNLTENGITTLITIPEGNYTKQSLVNAVKSALIAASPNNLVYNITFPKINLSADNGKLAFSLSSDPGYSIIFDFATPGNFHELLGFNRESYIFDNNTDLNSQNVIKIAIEDTILIKSNICNNVSDNTLQPIYSVSSSSYGAIVFENKNAKLSSKKIALRDTNVMHFWLTDENGIPMDLNGQNWIFTLLIY